MYTLFYSPDHRMTTSSLLELMKKKNIIMWLRYALSSIQLVPKPNVYKVSESEHITLCSNCFLYVICIALSFNFLISPQIMIKFKEYKRSK